MQGKDDVLFYFERMDELKDLMEADWRMDVTSPNCLFNGKREIRVDGLIGRVIHGSHCFNPDLVNTLNEYCQDKGLEWSPAINNRDMEIIIRKPED
jgi:hypothetical protein